METRSLNYFIAVAEEKNIHRAALRLHITQPALTRQIQSLEEELEAPLFTRTPAGMIMTPAGEALLLHARNIKSELELAKRNTRLANKSLPRQLDIGVYGSAIFTIIPQILEQFSAAHPDVKLVLHNSRKDQQIESLRRGRIMIAFDRFIPKEPDLKLELVCCEPTYVALHKNHPLAKQQLIELSELLDEPFIGARIPHFDPGVVSHIGFTPRIEQRADDLLSALALVGCGFGLTFAPLSISALQIRNVVYRPLSTFPGFSFDLLCMYRENEKSPLLQALLETVRSYRQEEAAQ
jgi:DNA-binding transcriptional LysR family regulator